MRYEWKARLLIGFFCLLLGLTLGVWTDGAAKSKLFIYLADALFFIAIMRFVVTTYIRINWVQQAGKRGEAQVEERDSF